MADYTVHEDLNVKVCYILWRDAQARLWSLVCPDPYMKTLNAIFAQIASITHAQFRIIVDCFHTIN